MTIVEFWDLFWQTLGLAYFLVTAILVGAVVLRTQHQSSKWKNGAAVFAWCTSVAALVNLLYVNVLARTIFFTVGSVVGVAVGSLFALALRESALQERDPDLSASLPPTPLQEREDAQTYHDQ